MWLSTLTIKLVYVSCYLFRKNTSGVLLFPWKLGLLLSVRWSLSKSAVLGSSGALQRHSAYVVQSSSTFTCSHKGFSDLRANVALTDKYRVMDVLRVLGKYLKDGPK